MSRRDLSHRDASSHASAELEYIIRGKEKAARPSVPMVASEKALNEDRVFKKTSARNITRVLFVSKNTELLNPTKQTLDGYVDISRLFDEVHILILRVGAPSKKPVIRLSKNVWIYTASAKFWWLMPKAGFEMAQNQLEFATGFRPDLVVARDPFESAVVASRLQKKYGCFTQLHVMEDFTTERFLKQDKHNNWRLKMIRFTIPKFSSVRTLTTAMQTNLQKRFTIPDVDTLPRYQNYEEFIDSKSVIDLKEKYKPFIFFIVFAGKLNHGSTLFRVIDAARFILKNPRIGLIVLGDGEVRNEFVRRAKILGVERQVIFERRAGDIVPYLKSSNILMVSDVDADSEDVVLKGAAAGIPMIMSRTDKREDLFVHGESAFLCESTDVQAFGDRINDLLNDIQLRKRFVKKGQSLIREQFHSDPEEYQESYRTSIEQAFFVESDESK